MNTTEVREYETCEGEEEYVKNCYFFSPSISNRKTVGGKAYYVRRYFRGGKDFEKTMETLALQHTIKNAR